MNKSGTVAVQLFCTDRGRHARRDWGWLRMSGYQMQLLRRPGRGKRVARPMGMGLQGLAEYRGGHSVNIRCPKCGRSPAFTALDCNSLLNWAMIDPNMSEVDIGYWGR